MYSACHSATWTDGWLTRFSRTVEETDKMVLTATGSVREAWKRGLVDRTNPFDEPLEIRWVRQWVFYANSIRYGSAMSGQVNMAFKNGWWSLNENLKAISQGQKSGRTQYIKHVSKSIVFPFFMHQNPLRESKQNCKTFFFQYRFKLL